MTKNKRNMILEVMRTGSWLDDNISKMLKQFELTHVQYNILRILRGALPEPLSAGEVKERSVFATSDITRLIDRLVGKEVVERKICPKNRRKMDITITEKGLQLLEEIEPVLVDEISQYENRISNEEALEVARILSKLKQTDAPE